MRVFLAATLVAMALAGRVYACDGAIPDRVRIVDCRLAAAVADAAARSPTLQTLLERVGRTDGLIYITPPVDPSTGLLGGLSHAVSSAGRFRLLRIFVSLPPDDRAIAVVGHELQHALEVLELSTARSEMDVDRLFERIGWHTKAHVIETQAALDAGGTIERELKRNPRARK